MSHYIVCTDCGKVYDINDTWQSSDHVSGACTNPQFGFCDSCGGGVGDLHTTNSGESVHKDQAACISHLKEQLTYVEQHNLEHDTRYCALEASINKLLEGRKAALDEAATLHAIRRAHDES